MEYDRYLQEFKNVIDQAETEHEVELMRKALIESRAHLERKAYAILQDAFRVKMGGR